MILFKSRLYREEIYRWVLVFSLFLWGLGSTIIAVSRSDKLMLISISDHGARLIQSEDDEALRDEAVKFIQQFVGSYLNFDSNSYSATIGQASDLMSEELWSRNQQKYKEIDQRMKSQPLSQTATIESIDAVSPNEFEVIALLRVRQKIEESTGRLKLRMSLRSKARNEANPWRFEIVELKDELL